MGPPSAPSVRPARRLAAACALALLAAACGDPPAPAPAPGPAPGRNPRLAGGPSNLPVLGPRADVDMGVVDGGLRRKSVQTGVYPLLAEQINVHSEPFRVAPFLASERAWVRRWSVKMEKMGGVAAPGDLQCHAILSQTKLRREGERFAGICTDGFTPHFELPEGFAVVVEPNERWLFQPMFNNRRPEQHEVRMRIDVDFVPDSERKRDYTRLYCVVTSVQDPQTYWVQPGQKDRRSRTFIFPEAGRVHAIGGHIHPYGKFLELVRESNGEVLHRATMLEATQLENERLTTYSSEKGFYVKANEILRVIAEYENPTDHPVDAMAGFFLFFDPSGKPDA